MFDLSKDWTCTLDHKAGEDTVKVTFTPKTLGLAAQVAGPTASLTLTISSLQDSNGVQRGIVLDK